MVGDGREEAVLTAYFKILPMINIFYPTPNEQTSCLPDGSTDGGLSHVKIVINVLYCMCQPALSEGLSKAITGRQTEHFYRELSHHS